MAVLTDKINEIVEDRQGKNEPELAITHVAGSEPEQART